MKRQIPVGYYVYQYLRDEASENGPVNSPYYVGKGTRGRAWLRFKKETFPPKDKSRINIIQEGMCERDAFQLEMLLIFLYGRIDKGTGCLRNKTDGGDGGRGAIRSEEQRYKYREASKARWQNPEYRQRMKIATTGVKRPPRSREAIEKQRLAVKGVPRKPMSEETKRRVSVSKKGKKIAPVSIERRLAQSARLKGKEVPREHIMAMVEARKRKRLVDKKSLYRGDLFDTMDE